MRFRFQAPFIMRTGYGKLSCWLAQCFLDRFDSKVEIFPHQGKLYEDVPEEIADAASKQANYRALGLLCSYPDHVNYLPTRLKAIYTMWETTRIPSKFASYLRMADVVFTPSTFCKSVFETEVSGVRVENVGCGVDTKFYTLREFKDDGPLHFGTCGVMSPRKGVDVLLEAFRAVAEKPDVLLSIKTRDTRWLPRRLPRNVRVIDEEWDEAQVRDFYGSLDYFILPTRGEGWGMTPVEAACCGVPGYVTNWSGPRDYVGDYIRPIEWSRLSSPPRSAFREDGHGRWVDPSVPHLASIFEELYNVGKPNRERRENVSRWARGNYSIVDVADRLHGGLRRLLDECRRPRH